MPNPIPPPSPGPRSRIPAPVLAAILMCVERASDSNATAKVKFNGLIPIGSMYGIYTNIWGIFRKILGLQTLEIPNNYFAIFFAFLLHFFCIWVCHFGFVLSFFCHFFVISLSFLCHFFVICLSFYCHFIDILGTGKWRKQIV